MTAPDAVIPQLFSESETADKLRLTVPTLRRRRYGGRIGYVKSGRAVFHTAEQITAFIVNETRVPCPQVTTSFSAWSSDIVDPSSVGSAEIR